MTQVILSLACPVCVACMSTWGDHTKSQSLGWSGWGFSSLDSCGGPVQSYLGKTYWCGLYGHYWWGPWFTIRDLRERALGQITNAYGAQYLGNGQIGAADCHGMCSPWNKPAHASQNWLCGYCLLTLSCSRALSFSSKKVTRSSLEIARPRDHVFVVLYHCLTMQSLLRRVQVCLLLQRILWLHPWMSTVSYKFEPPDPPTCSSLKYREIGATPILTSFQKIPSHGGPQMYFVLQVLVLPYWDGFFSFGKNFFTNLTESRGQELFLPFLNTSHLTYW